MAHYSREPQAIPLLGAGRLVVNVDTGRPNGFFQGIVPLTSDKLDECLEAYFQQSEQLPTRLILKSSEQRVAGMLLQILPGREEERAVDAFESAVASAATVTPAELTGLAAEELLPKLFADTARPPSISVSMTPRRRLVRGGSGAVAIENPALAKAMPSH